MPVEYFIEFEGKKYDVGTIVLYNLYYPEEGTITFISGYRYIITFEDGRQISLSKFDIKKNILKIVKPVEYKEETCKNNGLTPPPAWDVEVGWIWYILIMVVGSIFKDRWLIWLVATVVFSLWKIGFFRKK